MVRHAANALRKPAKPLIVPPRYLCKRSRHAESINGWRFFVENTK
jgi:hypothetical protein